MLRGFLRSARIFFFFSQMVDVEGLSALGKDLLLLFALSLAFVGFVLLGSSEVSTVVKGHIGDGLLLLVFLAFRRLASLCAPRFSSGVSQVLLHRPYVLR